MIEVFEGRIGGGKTISAVERMLKYFAQGGKVFTNIELKLDACKKYLRENYFWDYQEGQYILLNDLQIPEFHRHTCAGTPDAPVLVVLDEAHLWFNSRDWNSTSKELLTFLTQSRKQSTDVIFISQSLLNMDKQFMRLVQYVWTFTDLKRVGYPVNWPFIQSIPWPFPQILQKQFDYDGKTLLDRSFLWKKKAMFACYDTYTLLRTFPRLEAAKTNFKRDSHYKPSLLDLLRRFAPLPVGLCILLCLGGCRYVQVSDVRDENQKLKMALIELKNKVAKLENSPRSIQSNVSNNPLMSLPVPLASAVAPVAQVTTNSLRVCGVVNDRVCLSSGVWVSVGETDDDLGTLLAANPSNGKTKWLYRGEEKYRSCN